jgi:hypothetical protein
VTTARRSSPGQGTVHSYETGAGTRWAWKGTVTLPDGTRKVTHRRGYLTKTAANKALREALTASDKGSYSEPSKMPLAEYLDIWLDGLQKRPATVSSYRLLAAYLSAHRTMINGSALCAAWLSRSVTTLLA